MIRSALSAGPQGRRYRLFPQVRIPFSHRHRGFTLVEVMMSILLLAIGTALALPSYRDMVEKRQVTNAAEQLASFVNSAQGMAMMRNQVVTIKYKRDGDDDWCVGATLDADCTCNDASAENYCRIDAQPFVLDNSHTNNLDLMHAMTESEGSYAFDPVRGLASGSPLPLTMELRSPSGDFRINLMVNQTGRVILCSDDSSHAVPGYELCPAEPQAEG